jgi:hypothetical protein
VVVCVECDIVVVRGLVVVMHVMVVMVGSRGSHLANGATLFSGAQAQPNGLCAATGI